MSLSSAIEKLASYRTNNTRAAEETFEKGVAVLKSGSLKRLGDDGWAFLEQLALASIDIGRLDVADECIRQLSEKFPNSPRVDVLVGIRKEATEPPATALQYYDKLLEADPVNAAVWKRRISTLRQSGDDEKAAEELCQFLDTFYTDLEGWLELADLYSSRRQYTSALQALSHALILSPQNPFNTLQFAETAYTAGDVPLALKMFLVVAEMTERDAEKDDSPVGISIRAWMGVKLCSRQSVSNPNLPSASDTAVPKTVKLIEELATERLAKAYRAKQPGSAQVFAWMSS